MSLWRCVVAMTICEAGSVDITQPNATIQTAPSGARLQSLVGCEPSTGEKK